MAQVNAECRVQNVEWRPVFLLTISEAPPRKSADIVFYLYNQAFAKLVESL